MKRPLRRVVLALAAFAFALPSCDGANVRCNPTPSWNGDRSPFDASVGCSEGRCLPVGVGAGARHNCVQRRNGTFVCFGDNTFGQSDPARPLSPEVLPTLVSLPESEARTSSGSREWWSVGAAHFCLAQIGGVRCWGAPETTGGGTGPGPRLLPFDGGIERLSAASLHTCMTTTPVRSVGEPSTGEREAFCWGTWDGFDPASGPAITPRSVGDRDVASTGSFTTCTLLRGAGLGGLDPTRPTVECVGGSPPDGLPTAGPWFSETRLSVPVVDSRQAISVGSDHSCAAAAEARVLCWGANGRGQLGDGTLVDSETPVDVMAGILELGPIEDVPSVCSGGWGHLERDAEGRLHGRDVDGFSCASLGGLVWCWGANDHGQLGDGTFEDRAIPTRVALDVALQGVSCGESHVCAVGLDDQVWCWGANDHGQLGVPSAELADSPVPLPVVLDLE